MTMRRAMSSVVAMIGLLACARVARAGGDDATAHFDKGNVLYRQSRWAEAEAEFQKAWDARRSFDVAANLGDCELQIGQHREAAEHLAYALREFPLSGKAALRDRLQKRFAEARALVGTLRVLVNVPGASVSIDGRNVGIAPIDGELFVDPGERTVEAIATDYVTAKVPFSIAKGARREVTLVLEKKPAVIVAPPPPVIVEKRPVWPAIATGAGAAVMLGTGIGLAVMASGKRAEADAAQVLVGNDTSACAGAPPASIATSCKKLLDATASRDTLSNASLGLVLTGGAFAIAAVGLGIWSAVSPSQTKVSASAALRFVPVVGRDRGVAMVVGSW